MFHRPLIPVLFSLVLGICFSHVALSTYPFFVSFLSFLALFLLIASLFVSLPLRFPLFIALFFILGTLLDLNSHHGSDLLPLANKRERVIMEGTVLQASSPHNGRARLEIRSRSVSVYGNVRPIREKVLLTVFKHSRDFAPGESIRFPATLRPFKNFNNPGGYDYELAMSLRGLSCAAHVSDGRYIVPMGKGDLGFPMQMVEEIRRPTREFFREILSPQNQALFRALILGERQEISNELRESFNRVGLGHVLAVSGLHIGLVAWLTFFLSRWLLSRSYRVTLMTDIHRLAAFITCLPVVGYAGLTGFQVSGQRAMIMVLAYLFSVIRGREKEVWSTLALAALIVLALDPHALLSLSFQLSFGAVMGILWLAPSIYKGIFVPLDETKTLSTWTNRFYSYFAALISVTLSAILFLLPITVFYFHRISLISIPANLTIIPLLGLWVIPSGLLSVVLLPFSSMLAQVFLQFGAWGLEWMMGIIQFWNGFHLTDFWVVTPNLFEILLFYSLLFLIFFIRRWSWARVALVLVLILSLLDISYWVYRTHFNRYLKVTYLDVGQGNAALIQFPGKERMLIDGGGFSGDYFDVGRMVVAPFLWYSKISSVDYLVLTHPQEDHMSGLRFIASHFQPKEFWSNGDKVATPSFIELMRILESKKIKRLIPDDLRDGRDISGVDIKLLHPPSIGERIRSPDEYTGLNNNSLVLKLSYEGSSFLFPGDLEKTGEEVMISNAGPVLKSDILLAPHHGSKTSCSNSFLQMVRPRICIISSGSGSLDRFPHTETVKRLHNTGCRIIRIDESGAFQVSVEKNHLEMKSLSKGIN
ncbi:MAG: DNA internalization-related competence protein ComEC/Rec2 [Pseudomonadota bacterium]